MSGARSGRHVGRGVLGLRDLAARGVSADSAEREVRSGRWQRGAAGVYVTHADPLSDAERVLVAREHAGAGGVVTGGVVLRALGVRWVPASDDVHVLIPQGTRTRSSGIVRVIRTRELDAIETWSRWGTGVVNPERAVYDASRAAGSLRDVRGLVLGAVSDGWATVDGLGALLTSGQRNGSAHLRRAVADAERGCASPPEAEVVDELVGCGLPFYVNPAVLVGGRLVGYPDLWAVGLGVGGEVQSKERHGTVADEESTFDRDERFGSHGLDLVHLSVRRIRRDPREAASRFLVRARERAAWAPDRREPPGLEVRPRGPLLC